VCIGWVRLDGRLGIGRLDEANRVYVRLTSKSGWQDYTVKTQHLFYVIPYLVLDMKVKQRMSLVN